MANYPCPVCGASHKIPPEKCRLCGQMMGEDAAVGDFEGSRQVTKQKKGVAGLGMLVAGGVVLVALAAVLIGVLPGREEITEVATKVPGLNQSTKAGWAVLDDPDGGFSVEMPSETPEKETRSDVLPGSTAEAVVWSAWIGSDQLVEVAYIDDALPAGAREFDALSQLADAWELGFEASQTASLDSMTETTFSGKSAYAHPAIQFEARNVKLEQEPGANFYQRTLAFYNDGTLYTLTEYTTNPKSDAFDQIRSTFVLKNPAQVAGGPGTTNAPASAG